IALRSVAGGRWNVALHTDSRLAAGLRAKTVVGVRALRVGLAVVQRATLPGVRLALLAHGARRRRDVGLHARARVAARLRAEGPVGVRAVRVGLAVVQRPTLPGVGLTLLARGARRRRDVGLHARARLAARLRAEGPVSVRAVRVG